MYSKLRLYLGSINWIFALFSWLTLTQNTSILKIITSYLIFGSLNVSLNLNLLSCVAHLWLFFLSLGSLIKTTHVELKKVPSSNALHSSHWKISCHPLLDLYEAIHLSSDTHVFSSPILQQVYSVGNVCGVLQGTESVTSPLEALMKQDWMIVQESGPSNLGMSLKGLLQIPHWNWTLLVCRRHCIGTVS